MSMKQFQKVDEVKLVRTTLARKPVGPVKIFRLTCTSIAGVTGRKRRVIAGFRGRAACTG